MPRRLAAALPAALAALAVTAGPAPAKGVAGLEVCGATGCVDRSAEVLADPSLAEGLISYGVTVADPGPERFVRLLAQMGDGGQGYHPTTVAYLPAAGALRFEDGTFHRVEPQLRGRLRHLVRGVPLLPASAPLTDGRPAGSSVGERNAALARRTAAHRTAAAPPADDGGAPRAGWLLAAAAVVVGGVAALLALRRRRGPTGRPAAG